jgi:hypothetical protein
MKEGSIVRHKSWGCLGKIVYIKPSGKRAKVEWFDNVFRGEFHRVGYLEVIEGSGFARGNLHFGA